MIFLRLFLSLRALRERLAFHAKNAKSPQSRKENCAVDPMLPHYGTDPTPMIDHKQKSPALERRLPLLQKRTHTFILIFCREAKGKEIHFAAQPFVKV